MNYQNNSVTKTVQIGRKYLMAVITYSEAMTIIELSKY